MALGVLGIMQGSSGGGAGGSFSAGMSNAGNTSGTSGTVTGQVVFVGGSNIGLSQSVNAGSATLSINLLPIQIGGVIQDGNTAGTTGQIAQSIEFAGYSGITLSQSRNTNFTGGTISIIGGAATMSQWQPGPGVGNMTPGQYVQSHLFFMPATMDNYGSFSRANLYNSVSISTSSNSSHAAAVSMYIGIYTLNSNTFSLASSGSQSFAWTNSSNNSTAVLSGIKQFSIPINISATPGNYYIGILSLTATTNANWATISNMMYTNINASNYSGPIGSNSNSSYVMFFGMAADTGNTAALPSSISARAFQGNSSFALMPPVIEFLNMTV